jgi:hypothetical protein
VSESPLNLAIAETKIHADLGETVEAQTIYNGYKGYQLERALALTEIEMKSTGQSTAAQRLRASSRRARPGTFGRSHERRLRF